MAHLTKGEARGVLRRAFETAPDAPPDFAKLLSVLDLKTGKPHVETIRCTGRKTS